MIDIYEVAGRNGSETVWRQESIGVPDVILCSEAATRRGRLGDQQGMREGTHGGMDLRGWAS